MKNNFIVALLCFSCLVNAQENIWNFTSVTPAGQSDTFVFPVTHRFQKLIEEGDILTHPSMPFTTFPDRADFAGFVPIAGSSENGYLAVNSEANPGGVTILDINYNGTTKLWDVSASEKVDFSGVAGTIYNCSGAITAWGTMISCEERVDENDSNNDNYNDHGWAIEIDPVTREVVNNQKLWALGNFKHENVSIHGNDRTVYQGVDDNIGYLYKFVADVAQDLSSGRLFVYKGSKNGSGDWIELNNTTPADRNSTLSQSAALEATVFKGIEDVEIGPDGRVYFAVKNEHRVYSFQDSDPLIGTTVMDMKTFVGGTTAPDPETEYEITDEGGTTSVAWGTGNDNLAFDGDGNLWVYQDGGNNYIWVVEAGHTQASPKVKLFGIAPNGSEPTGITFSPDYRFLFMSVQHPDGANNTTTQTDASGVQIGFHKDITFVIALKDDLGLCAIEAPTTHSGGSWDNGAPNMNRNVTILDNLSTGGTSIDACVCQVDGSLTVQDGDYLRVHGDITVNGVVTVNNQGSLVQINDDATVTNDGTISVLKTTPAMDAKSFMVSGSPMTGETREGVFGPAYIVRNHNTGNFIPNADVEDVSPGINNWADDNGNNWLTHTGGLNPGEGYMVFPQPNGTASGTYTQTHTLGTLNNGVVDFNMGYNGSQNASPNFLSNPYASAIDAEAFFDHPLNSNIDVVYFWEHLTPLSAGYPGYSPANFNMGDISLYSESLAAGVPAANGGATPTQFIASGQGFGVKPTAGGIAQFNNAMRVTGPNDSYRSSDPVNRDRIWMNVYNDTYGLGSTTLIGFTENTSDEYTISEDVHRLPTPVSLYSELETGEELVVNALGTFETEDAIYLSFTTQVKEAQDYRISIQAMDGVNLENTSVYLIDNLSGSVTNLTEGDYTFQSGEAVNHKRFKVVFEYSALGINTSNLDMVSLYPNPVQNTVTIVSPQTIVTSAKVHDIRGRLVSEVDFGNQRNYQIDLSTMEAAVYFIEITTENGTVMKRVMKR